MLWWWLQARSRPAQGAMMLQGFSTPWSNRTDAHKRTEGRCKPVKRARGDGHPPDHGGGGCTPPGSGPPKGG
jgi:hypothetical protein